MTNLHCVFICYTAFIANLPLPERVLRANDCPLGGAGHTHMFMLKEYLFGATKRAHHKEEHHEEELQEQTAYEDYYDYYPGTEEWDGGTSMPFPQLELDYSLRMGELTEFYEAIYSHYSYEIPTVANNQTDCIDRFLLTFLPHLWHMAVTKTLPADEYDPGSTDYVNIRMMQQPDRTLEPSTMCSVADLRYNTNTMENFAACLDGMACSTFRVDSRLDSVYAMLFDRAMLDILTQRANVFYSENNADAYSLISQYLETLEKANKHYRVCSRYTVCERSRRCQQGRQKNCPFEWSIYTRKSSQFYQECRAVLEGNPEFGVNEYYQSEQVVPFTLVLFLCGNCPEFKEVHTVPTVQGDGILSVKATLMGEWLSVPVWYYFMWIAMGGQKQQQPIVVEI